MELNKIYKTAKECIGKDMSAKYDEYGCAEALNAVFKLAVGREVGGGVSTYRMYKAILQDKDFRLVATPELGDIIISPTGYGVGTGHVGIVSDNNRIMSNNSRNSKWEEYYSMFMWEYKYKSFQTSFFRYKYAIEIIEEKIEDIKPPTEKIENIKKQITLYEKLVILYRKIINLLK